MSLFVVNVIVDNSMSTITGLNAEQFKALRKLLSYQTDASAAFFAGGNYPRFKYMIDVKGTFPTGLLHRVWEFLKESQVASTVTDRRETPISSVESALQGITPYPAQTKAAMLAELMGHGIISMATGTGKSLVIALIASKIGVKTLVVVPSVEIKKQLILAIRGFLTDSSHITVENIDSASLQKPNGYDCLIIDEAHHVAAKTYQKLNRTAWKGIYYRFFLTATPFRNQTEETLLFEGIAGQVIYNLPYKKAIKEKYIVPVEAYYFETPKQKTDAYTWAQVYKELVVENEARNQMLAVMMLRFNASKKATLVLVKEVKHGEILAKMTGLPFANGKDEDSRQYIGQFNRAEIPVLIGTEGILGEGVDSKPCEYVIIAGAGKAKSAFMQKIGRCVRTYPGKESGKVILVKDRSHKFLTRHFNEQVKILEEEYGVKAIKLDLD